MKKFWRKVRFETKNPPPEQTGRTRRCSAPTPMIRCVLYICSAPNLIETKFPGVSVIGWRHKHLLHSKLLESRMQSADSVTHCLTCYLRLVNALLLMPSANLCQLQLTNWISCCLPGGLLAVRNQGSYSSILLRPVWDKVFRPRSVRQTGQGTNMHSTKQLVRGHVPYNSKPHAQGSPLKNFALCPRALLRSRLAFVYRSGLEASA
jgi:hypothetical protein